jgi:alpha-tubulin suppressor-like RCC1 family protein
MRIELPSRANSNARSKSSLMSLRSFCWILSNYFELGKARDTRQTSAADLPDDSGGVIRMRQPILTRCNATGLAILIVLLVAMCWPNAAGAATSVLEVSAGEYHTCAVLSSGATKCWGDNNFGQLGNGSSVDSSTPVSVSGLAAAVSVGAGISHTCSVLSNGSINCWGNNFAGQLGNGSTAASLNPVNVIGLTGAVSVSAGNGFSCAVLSGGVVKCWGSNSNGQLGNGSTLNSSSPVTVSGISGATSVSAGYFHACAVLSDGAAKCWGKGDFGQLGSGSTTNSSTPVAVSGIGNARTISAGNAYTCAVLSTGIADCWGNNWEGELGNGTTTSSVTPVPVSGMNSAVAITADNNHTCAVVSAGGVNCWSTNSLGQLGDGSTTSSSTPVVVRDIGDAVSVTAGALHSCAALSSGVVNCWGSNAFGQLGNGSLTSSSTPVRVRGIEAAGPVFGKAGTLEPVSGAISIKLPGAAGFVPLKSQMTVPMRTVVDTSGGVVKLTTSTGNAKRTQSGRFSEGTFKLNQHRERPKRKHGRRVGVTDLALQGGESIDCAAGAGSIFFAKSRKKRHLWGDGHGNYKTDGKYASGSVRGTKWLTEDNCEGTRITVKRGLVDVFDKVKHKTVLVKAGHSYSAKAPKS